MLSSRECPIKTHQLSLRTLPSLIAHTTSDCPRRMSPQANIFEMFVWKAFSLAFTFPLSSSSTSSSSIIPSCCGMNKTPSPAMQVHKVFLFRYLLLQQSLQAFRRLLSSIQDLRFLSAFKLPFSSPTKFFVAMAHCLFATFFVKKKFLKNHRVCWPWHKRSACFRWLWQELKLCYRQCPMPVGCTYAVAAGIARQ